MPDRILHMGNRFGGGTRAQEFAAGMLRNGRLAALRAGVPWEPFDLGDPDAPLPVNIRAYVNAANLGGSWQWQGRWIARCPDPDCGGAEYVDLAQPVFMCCSCWNAAHGHAWLTVTLPPARERAQIETLLLRRKGVNRHWLPGESVAQLRAENRALGVGADIEGG